MIDSARLRDLLADPVATVKAAGVPISPQSHVGITIKNRSHRTPTAQAAAMARIIIIIIHYRNCDADIWIIY